MADTTATDVSRFVLMAVASAVAEPNGSSSSVTTRHLAANRS
jgi:hypothetical protein